MHILVLQDLKAVDSIQTVEILHPASCSLMQTQFAETMILYAEVRQKLGLGPARHFYLI